MELKLLQADPLLLLLAVALDGTLGDPVYRLHPIRLIGAALAQIEKGLRRLHIDGYVGGCLLFVALAGLSVGGISAVVLALGHLHNHLAWVFHLFMIYSLIALRDLIKHGLEIDRAAHSGDLPGARRAASMLVGRDTGPMDAMACRRAGMESLSENAVDGFISPIFWYALLGLPGLVLFKVISTMDSMVGYKNSHYIHFGWCGARLDDLFNWLPARMSCVLVVLVALFVPGASAYKALSVGWEQHDLVPGPNSGWSEAAVAGALQCRLIGPIWQDGVLVTEVWLGDPGDREGGLDEDLRRTSVFIAVVCLIFVGAAAFCIGYGR